MLAGDTTLDAPSMRERAYVPVAVLVIAFGVFLRVLGYFGDGLQLWLDEASWAQMLVDGEATWIRPAGYMWLTGRLVAVVNNEQTLRSLSLIAGIAQLPLLLAVLRRTLDSRWIALIGVYLLAINPVAIGMSKEFKPYAGEAALHAALILCALAYWKSRRRVHMVALAATAVLAPLFAWSVVFAYPSVFGVVGWRALRLRDPAAERTAKDYKDAAIAAVAAVATLGLLAVIFALKVAGEDEKTNFWGQKYGVFYMGRSWWGQVEWLAEATLRLAAAPGDLEISVPIPQWNETLQLLFAGLCVIGAVGLLVRRQWMLATIWILPWVITALFNLAGKWPYGVFRTNVYMQVYALGLLCHGIEVVGAVFARGGVAPRRLGYALVAVLAVSAFPFDLDAFRIKTERGHSLSSSVRTAMEEIYAAELPVKAVDGKQRVIVMDGHACGIWRYYADYHSETRERFGRFFGESFTTYCGGFVPWKWRKLLADRSAEASWIISAKPPFSEITREPNGCKVISQQELPNSTTLLRCQRSAP